MAWAIGETLLLAVAFLTTFALGIRLGLTRGVEIERKRRYGK